MLGLTKSHMNLKELKFIGPDSGHRFETETLFWTYVIPHVALPAFVKWMLVSSKLSCLCLSLAAANVSLGTPGQLLLTKLGHLTFKISELMRQMAW